MEQATAGRATPLSIIYTIAKKKPGTFLGSRAGKEWPPGKRRAFICCLKHLEAARLQTSIDKCHIGSGLITDFISNAKVPSLQRLVAVAEFQTIVPSIRKEETLVWMGAADANRSPLTLDFDTFHHNCHTVHKDGIRQYSA